MILLGKQPLSSTLPSYGLLYRDIPDRDEFFRKTAILPIAYQTKR